VVRVERGALASEIGAVALARHHLRETLWDEVRVELFGGSSSAAPSNAHVRPTTARYPE
jgi:hypothetical protein